MTVTNALGQQVTVAQPFYASSSLLAPGLHSFAVEAGWVRRNWGVVSNDYGKIAATGMFRTGVTPKFTFEASAEGTPGAVMAGAGGVAQIGNLGVLNFSAAASGGGGHVGGLASAGAQRIGKEVQPGSVGDLRHPHLPGYRCGKRRGSSHQTVQRFRQSLPAAFRYGGRGFRRNGSGCRREPDPTGIVCGAALSGSVGELFAFDPSHVALSF